MIDSNFNDDELRANKKKARYKRLIVKRLKIFVCAIIMLVTCFIISLQTKKVISLSYKEDSNINYLVYLKPNDYYTSPYLTKGMQYIASLIDYIDVDFNYNFKMNEQIKYNYYYYIEANIKVFEKDNPSNIIYKKSSKIVDNTSFYDQDSLYFTIDEDLKINYGEYNDLIKSFKNSYNVIADSDLTLTLHVYIDGEHEDFDKPIRTDSTMNLVIPLTEQMVNVSMDYKEVNNSDVIKQTSTKGTLSNIFLGISIFILAIVVILLLDLIRLILKAMTRKTSYQKKLDSLLREYDRVIVDVNSSNYITKNDNFIRVKSFEELLDVSDRLQKPILHYEAKKDYRNLFMVKEEEDIYYYFLDASELSGGDDEKYL